MGNASSLTNNVWDANISHTKFIDYWSLIDDSHYCLLSRNGDRHDCDVKLRNLGCAQSYTTWRHNHGRLRFPLEILSQKSDPTWYSSHFSQVRGQDFQKDKCVMGRLHGSIGFFFCFCFFMDQSCVLWVQVKFYLLPGIGCTIDLASLQYKQRFWSFIINPKSSLVLEPALVQLNLSDIEKSN